MTVDRTKLKRLPVPAFCNNPSCRTIWLAQSPFALPEGGTVFIAACQVGPCPVCKGFGRIPDGKYVRPLKRLFAPAQAIII